MTSQQQWFSDMAGRKLTVVELAKHLDVSRNTARARLDDGLTSDEIITIARSLHINPVTALEELGKLTVAEIFDYLDADGTLVSTASQEQLIYYLAENGLTIEDKRKLSRDIDIDNIYPLHPDMPDDAVADSSPEIGGTPDDYDM